MSNKRVGLKLFPRSAKRVGLKRELELSDRVSMKPGSYDVAVDGDIPGAVTNLDLGMDKVPVGARIVRASYIVGTTFVDAGTDLTLLGIEVQDSAGATLLTLVTAIDIANVGVPWDASSVDILDGDIAGLTAALASEGTVVLTSNGTEIVNAGDLEVFVEYVVGA